MNRVTKQELLDAAEWFELKAEQCRGRLPVAERYYRYEAEVYRKLAEETEQ